MNGNDLRAEAPPSSGLAIASLVLGILGIVCFPLIGVIGLILGIVALVKCSKGTASGQGMAIGGVITGVLSVIMIPIMMALVVPSMLRARQGALEANTIGSCRAYANAQVMFHRNDWDNDGKLEYATPYTLLNTKKDTTGSPIDLIDSALAAAQGPNGVPKHGYIFQDMQTIGGVKINWVDDYALCAIPAQYGKTGRRTFIINTMGTVFGKDQGPGGTFVTDFPNNPTTAGWIIAE